MIAGGPLPESYEEQRSRSAAREPAPLQVVLFGPGRLWRSDGVVRQVVVQPKAFAVLARLALTPGNGLVRRDALLALLWPEVDTVKGRNALSQALHRLRRHLGPGAIVSRGREEVGLSERVWCDVRRFREALAGDELPAALALVRGSLLEAFHVSSASAFEHWLDVQRHDVREAAFGAALTLAERQEAAGRAAEASRWLRRAVDICPEDDTTLQRLIRSLRRIGDTAGAIRAYDAAAAKLWVDFESEPSRSTRALAEELRRTHRAPDPGARQAFLRGRHMSGVPGQAEAALSSFGRAIARDPDYPEAHAGVAECLATLALLGHLSREQAADRLEAAARRAMELGPEQSDPHVAQGVGRLVFSRDWDGAERAFRRAVELDPLSARAHAHLAFFLSTMGWLEEGVVQASRAVELDPLDPLASFLHGFALYRARRYEASLEELLALVELEPHHSLARMFVAENDLRLGRTDAAIQAARSAATLMPEDPLLTGICASILGFAGEHREARALLERLGQLAGRRYVNPHFVAAAHAGLGELDQAFRIWDSMVDDGAPGAFLLRTDPLFDPVRSDPRFASLMERLRFPILAGGAPEFHEGHQERG